MFSHRYVKKYCSYIYSFYGNLSFVLYRLLAAKSTYLLIENNMAQQNSLFWFELDQAAIWEVSKFKLLSNSNLLPNDIWFISTNAHGLYKLQFYFSEWLRFMLLSNFFPVNWILLLQDVQTASTIWTVNVHHVYSQCRL